jgi:hypothetical protein
MERGANGHVIMNCRAEPGNRFVQGWILTRFYR